MTTGKGTCGEACHNNLFNPLGFAFENYDAIGKYRTTDVGQPVDAADSYMLDGQRKTFTNGVELSQFIGRRQGDARLLRAEHDELPARAAARTIRIRRWSTTTPGCHAPGCSTFTIWSSPS